jgi:hypothetical protein
MSFCMDGEGWIDSDTVICGTLHPPAVIPVAAATT